MFIDNKRENKMLVNEMIKDLRIKLGVNKAQFARLLWLRSRAYIQFLEDGTRHPSTVVCYRLIDLAKTVGMEWTLEMLNPRLATPPVSGQAEASA
jgi:DNA-binding XRE family transcriptional regulator